MFYSKEVIVSRPDHGVNTSVIHWHRVND